MYFGIADDAHYGPEFEATAPGSKDVCHVFAIGFFLVGGKVVAIYGAGLAVGKVEIGTPEKKQKQNKVD